MSQETVALVRLVHDAFDRGDYEAALSCMDEEIELFGPPDFSGGDGAFRGHEGVRRGFRAWLGTWDSYRFELRDVIDAGDRVLVTGWHTGRGRGSGVEVSEDFLTVWTVRSGRVVGLSMFRDRREAFEAAGLRE